MADITLAVDDEAGLHARTAFIKPLSTNLRSDFRKKLAAQASD